MTLNTLHPPISIRTTIYRANSADFIVINYDIVTVCQPGILFQTSYKLELC